MAVSPIGNIVYVNQNQHANVSQQANQIHKAEFQGLINLNSFSDKLKELQEVRPTQESEAINKDRERESEERESDPREERRKKREAVVKAEHEEELERIAKSMHILDIKG